MVILLKINQQTKEMKNLKEMMILMKKISMKKIMIKERPLRKDTITRSN